VVQSPGREHESEAEETRFEYIYSHSFYRTNFLYIIKSCASAEPAALGLNEAVKDASAKIEKEVPKNSKVGVLPIVVPSSELLDHLTKEVRGQLCDDANLIVLDEDRTVLDRQKLTDAEAARLGLEQGMDVVITIDFNSKLNRFSVYAVDTKTTRLLTSYSKMIRNDDKTLMQLLGNKDVAPQKSIERDVSWLLDQSKSL